MLQRVVFKIVKPLVELQVSPIKLNLPEDRFNDEDSFVPQQSEPKFHEMLYHLLVSKCMCI